MDHKFYKFASFFLGLTAIISFFYAVLFLEIGKKIVFFDSFPFWFFVLLFISLAAEIFVLKYYHYKKYRFAFSAGLLGLIALICHSFVLYYFFMGRKLEYFLEIFDLILLVTALFYGISLSFSKAKSKSWLRVAGFFILGVQFIIIACSLLIVNFPATGVNVVLEKIIMGSVLLYSLLPVWFMLNFRSESKAINADKVPARLSGFSNSFWGPVGVLAILFTLISGSMLAQDFYWHKKWEKERQIKAQELDLIFEARAFVGSNGDTLHYRFLKPQDYDPQKKYPVVVCLHGGGPGSHGTDNIWQLSTPPTPLLSKEENRRKHPAFLFVPQCPKGTSWWEGLSAHSFPSSDSLVFEALAALEEEFSIDEKRRYVAGVSGGGFGSWHFISTRPEMFAAAIPVCGEGNPKLAPNMVDVPVWAFHGSNDRNVPVSGSRDMITAIKKAGGNPKYTEFPHESHSIWEIVEETPGLMDWLFAQERD